MSQSLTPRAAEYLALYRNDQAKLTECQFAEKHGFGNTFRTRWIEKSPEFRAAFHKIEAEKKQKREMAQIRTTRSQPPVHEAGMPDAQVTFLETWRATLDRRSACSAARVTVRQVREWLEEDEKFRECWKDVVEEMNWRHEDSLSKAAEEGKVNAQVRYLERHDPDWKRQGSRGSQKRPTSPSISSAADRVKEWLS